MPARELEGQTLHCLCIKSNTGVEQIINNEKTTINQGVLQVEHCAQVVDFVFVYFFKDGFAANVELSVRIGLNTNRSFPVALSDFLEQ